MTILTLAIITFILTILCCRRKRSQNSNKNKEARQFKVTNNSIVIPHCGEKSSSDLTNLRENYEVPNVMKVNNRKKGTKTPDEIYESIEYFEDS